MVRLENMAGVKLRRGSLPRRDARAHRRHRRAHQHDAGQRELGAAAVAPGRSSCSASAARKRLPAAPDVPTVAEIGLPGYEAATWFGLSATAGTPRDVVMKINTDVRKILAEPEFREKFLAPQLYEPMGSSPEEFADFIKTETQKWAKVIREQKLAIDK